MAFNVRTLQNSIKTYIDSFVSPLGYTFSEIVGDHVINDQITYPSGSTYAPTTVPNVGYPSPNLITYPSSSFSYTNSGIYDGNTEWYGTRTSGQGYDARINHVHTREIGIRISIPNDPYASKPVTDLRNFLGFRSYVNTRIPQLMQIINPTIILASTLSITGNSFKHSVDQSYVEPLSILSTSMDEAFSFLVDDAFLARVIIDDLNSISIDSTLRSSLASIDPNNLTEVDNQLLIRFAHRSANYSMIIAQFSSIQIPMQTLSNLMKQISYRSGLSSVSSDIQTNASPFDDPFRSISSYTVFTISSASQNLSVLATDDYNSAKSVISNTFSFLSRSLLTFASFLAKLAYISAKIVARIFIRAADIVLSISAKLVDLFLLPDVDVHYTYVSNDSPFHTPLCRLKISQQQFDEYFSNISPYRIVMLYDFPVFHTGTFDSVFIAFSASRVYSSTNPIFSNPNTTFD